MFSIPGCCCCWRYRDICGVIPRVVSCNNITSKCSNYQNIVYCTDSTVAKSQSTSVYARWRRRRWSDSIAARRRSKLRSLQLGQRRRRWIQSGVLSIDSLALDIPRPLPACACSDNTDLLYNTCNHWITSLQLKNRRTVCYIQVPSIAKFTKYVNDFKQCQSLIRLGTRVRGQLHLMAPSSKCP